MDTVVWAGIATDEAMGLQGYERSVQDAMRMLAPPDLRWRRVAVTSVRGRPALRARRTAMGAAAALPDPAARALGALTYRTRELVHRFDLRLPPAAGAEVLTVHDLPGLHFTDEAAVPRSAARSARRARAVICPSQFAADEIVRALGVPTERVHVIANGVAGLFASARPAGGLVAGRYVVHAAGATQRKNLRSLAAAWTVVAARCPGVTLALCGPPDPRRDEAFRDVPSVRVLGRCTPDQVARLMAGAAAVVVPSTYEGFGLPALEAMAAGAPVVAARAGALPEVCGPAALLVEPTAGGLAAGLVTVLDDPSDAAARVARGREWAAGFTWERAAGRHVDIYRAVLRERAGRR